MSIGQGAQTPRQDTERPHRGFHHLVSQGAIVLDKTLKERTNALATSIGQGADVLDKTLQDRTECVQRHDRQKAALLDGPSSNAPAPSPAVDSAPAGQVAARPHGPVHHRHQSRRHRAGQDARRAVRDLQQFAVPAGQGARDRHRPADRVARQDHDGTGAGGHHGPRRAAASDRRHVRPAHGRDRPDARRACAGNVGDVRQADRAAQSGARQQLGDDPADRQSGRRAVQGSHGHPHQPDPDAA